MAITVDAMAERYGKLPSEVLRDASTVDLIVFDVAVSYRNHNQNKAKGVADTNDYSQTDLEERFDRVRKKDEG
jgi:hypothetical protein|tara:strand:- start:438 stop:656 length:219 start_codon:yes stop_codon:yes gene_type:complete